MSALGFAMPLPFLSDDPPYLAKRFLRPRPFPQRVALRTDPNERKRAALRSAITILMPIGTHRSTPSPSLISRPGAKPPARNSGDRTAQQRVRDKGECDRNNDRFSGIECLKHDQLIDQIHTQPEKNNPRGGDQPFVEATKALQRIGEQRPEIRRTSRLCVVDAVTHRGNHRHGRLQDEPERHRSSWTVDQLLPDAMANF